MYFSYLICVTSGLIRDVAKVLVHPAVMGSNWSLRLYFVGLRFPTGRSRNCTQTTCSAEQFFLVVSSCTTWSTWWIRVCHRTIAWGEIHWVYHRRKFIAQISQYCPHSSTLYPCHFINFNRHIIISTYCCIGESANTGSSPKKITFYVSRFARSV